MRDSMYMEDLRGCKYEKDLPRVDGHKAIKPLAPSIPCVQKISAH